MAWLYRLTSNDEYPDPVEVIDALCTLDDDGEQAFLLLSHRSAPPYPGLHAVMLSASALLRMAG